MMLRRALAALALAGCALTQKSEPLAVRWFTPETERPRLTSAAAPAAPAAHADAPPLRLGRVTSGRHLRERMVYRDPSYEVGFYDDRRWTERPEVYVRHALAKKLFDDGAATPVVGGDVPVLDVEVLAFEELRRAGARAGRVSLRLVIHDDSRVFAEDTVTVDEPAESERPSAVVAAIAQALDVASDRVRDRAKAALRAPVVAPQ